VIKPLVGAALDGPGNAAVLQPLRHSMAGLAVGCGINPRYGRIDPYWMALACVDEALRNVVAVGGDPNQTAILDNFCWGDPRLPDRMAGLVRAAAGCYDAAVAFGTPYISGKDSLNNEYRDAAGNRVAIPPTLLISALAHVPDVRQCVTMDAKEPGNYIYLLGETRNELGGSHLTDLRLTIDDLRLGGVLADNQSPIANLPKVDLAAARRTFAALHGAMRAGLVRACHDLSEGGLAVAAAEMAIAGELGIQLGIEGVELRNSSTTTNESVILNAQRSILYSETPSRFLVEVAPANAAAFESAMAEVVLTRLGTVQASPQFVVRDGDDVLIDVSVADLKAAWQGGLEGSGL
jgi:phosphoribosylformylglycinamidine synthase